MSFCSIILIIQFIIILLLILKINKKSKDINKDTNNLKEILEINDSFIEKNHIIISEHLLKNSDNVHKKGKTLKEIKTDREARDRANL
jgi:hypothetical protein